MAGASELDGGDGLAEPMTERIVSGLARALCAMTTQRQTGIRAGLAAARVFAACGMAAGCHSSEGPCYGLAVGDRLRLELGEVYDASSSYPFDLGIDPPPSCGPDLDLRPGDVIGVRVVEHERDDSCDRNVADIELGAPHPLGKRAGWFTIGGSINAQVFHASGTTTIAGCVGRWEIELQGWGEPDGEGGDPYRQPVLGQRPPLILARGFLANEPTPACQALLEQAATACADYFVVLVRPG